MTLGFIALNFTGPGKGLKGLKLADEAADGLKYLDEVGYAGRGALKARSFRHYGYAEDAESFAGGMKPGSYATHAIGRPMHGKSAQQKLSLPHADPPNAYYRVRIGPETNVTDRATVPSTKTPLRTGGGIEYRFPNGTPPGSVEGPFPIP
ncbi:MAG: hypothetical protein ACYCXJ_05270 [Thermoleophilia bacterium]